MPTALEEFWEWERGLNVIKRQEKEKEKAMREVTFGREILTTQETYRKNHKVIMIITDAVKDGETAEEAFDRVKKLVDRKVTEQLVKLSTGEDIATQIRTQSKRKNLAKVASAQYGLSFDETYFDNEDMWGRG